MTAKRFRFYQDIYEVMYVEDMQGDDIKLAHEEDMNPKDAIKVVELLNNLHEEKELLIEFIKKDHPKTWRHILEDLE